MISPKKVSPKIKKLAKQFGIQFRFGKTPKEVNILGVSDLSDVAAAYFGQGVIWVNTSHSPAYEKNINAILLHEIGHATIDLYRKNTGKIPQKTEENMANAIALAFAAQLRIPLRVQIIKDFGRYARSKKLWLEMRS